VRDMYNIKRRIFNSERKSEITKKTRVLYFHRCNVLRDGYIWILRTQCPRLARVLTAKHRARLLTGRVPYWSRAFEWSSTLNAVLQSRRCYNAHFITSITIFEPLRVPMYSLHVTWTRIPEDLNRFSLLCVLVTATARGVRRNTFRK
jgi:hypothetical protein